MAGPNGRAYKGPHGEPVTHPSPRPPGMSSVLERNIETLRERREREEREATFQERLAEAVTRFTGSMVFVYIAARRADRGGRRNGRGPAGRGAGSRAGRSGRDQGRAEAELRPWET